jgi:hypothetical protein
MPTPKKQSYPRTKIFVGAVLYSAFAFEYQGAIESGFDEWVVRTIQARRGSKSIQGMSLQFKGIEMPKAVNVVRKDNNLTWGKLSSKTGDFGWKKYIPREARRQFTVGADLPFGIYTTKRAALTYELASQLDSKDWCENELKITECEVEQAELTEDIALHDRQIKVLKRRMKALAKANASACRRETPSPRSTRQMQAS